MTIRGTSLRRGLPRGDDRSPRHSSMSADPLATITDKMAAAGEPQIAARIFAHYYRLLRAGGSGKLPAREVRPVGDVPDVSQLAPFADAGRAALHRTALLRLNGGLGTSMGMTAPKSLLAAKSGLSFLDVIVRQTLAFRRTFDARLPLLLMNSFHTHEATLAALAGRGEPDGERPVAFRQHRVPRLWADDLTPVSWPQAPQHEWCPPGHGDIYPALASSGLLEALLADGIEYLFVSNADNLGAHPDPAVLGWMARERLPFVMEVFERTAADRKGGHVARLPDGRLVLREIAQCPADEIEAFQDPSVHRYFNANNVWLDLRAVRDALLRTDGVLGLPMIVNEKPVVPGDPTSRRVLQLETAMGAALSVFPDAGVVRIPRSRAVPVKTTSDLLVLRSDAYVIMADDHRVVPSPSRSQAAPPFVDLDDRFYGRVEDLDRRFPHGPPSLVDCSRLVVRGDVRFGRDVVVRGDARIEHAGPDPRIVPDDARLGDAEAAAAR